VALDVLTFSLVVRISRPRVLAPMLPPPPVVDPPWCALAPPAVVLLSRDPVGELIR
jgi:hypothetical protein